MYYCSRRVRACLVDVDVVVVIVVAAPEMRQTGCRGEGTTLDSWRHTDFFIFQNIPQCLREKRLLYTRTVFNS